MALHFGNAGRRKSACDPGKALGHKTIQPPYTLAFLKEVVMIQPEIAKPKMPEYGQSPAKPGLYLGLFHGRDDPNQTMDGWGFHGPAIGPLEWCHTTYAHEIKLAFESKGDEKTYFADDCVQTVIGFLDDMVVFEGKYYGDWTVYYVNPEDCLPPADTFRPNQRSRRKIAHETRPK